MPARLWRPGPGPARPGRDPAPGPPLPARPAGGGKRREPPAPSHGAPAVRLGECWALFGTAWPGTGGGRAAEPLLALPGGCGRGVPAPEGNNAAVCAGARRVWEPGKGQPSPVCPRQSQRRDAGVVGIALWPSAPRPHRGLAIHCELQAEMGVCDTSLGK